MDQRPDERLCFSPMSVKKSFGPCKELSGWNEDLQYRCFADPGCTPLEMRPLKARKSSRYSKVSKKPLVYQSYSNNKDSVFSDYYTHLYPCIQAEPIFMNKLIQGSLGHSLSPVHTLNSKKRYKSIFERRKSKVRNFYIKNSIVGQRTRPAVSGLSVTYCYR